MIDWIITSSVLILAVMAIRYALKGKISLRLQYALWALVLLRLLIPMNLGHSHVSVMNLFSLNNRNSMNITGLLGHESIIPVQSSDITGCADNVPGFEFSDIPADTNAVMDTYGTANNPGMIAKTVWFVGIAIIGLYFLISNIRFAVKLRRARRKIDIGGYPVSIYETDIILTPCMFGLFRPAIYITQEVLGNEMMLRHVLEHEMTHRRHKDHIWSLFRCICLALHWYNPLVWMAAFYSMKDAELSCDETTIRIIGEDERIEYGRTIIDLTCTKSGMDKLLMTATTMTGSKKSIEDRITLIARKPKTALYISIIVFLVAVIAVGCTFTGAEMNEIEKWFPQPEIEDQGIQGIGKADINGDGKDEYIYLNKSQMNEGLATLIIGDGKGHELWNKQFSTSHAGWGQLFLCELDDKQYLLKYNPAMFQGNATYAYTLFTLRDGKEKVSKTDSIKFDINGTKELDVSQMLSFADEINSLLIKSTLLISSNDSVFHFGPGSAEPYFERYSWLDGNPELYEVGDSLQVKLGKYSKFAVSNLFHE